MSLFKISLFVLGVHAALIFWALSHAPSLPAIKPQPVRVVTQEVVFNPKPAVKAVSDVQVEEKPEPKTVEKPEPKTVEKPEPKTVEKPEPKTVEKTELKAVEKKPEPKVDKVPKVVEKKPVHKKEEKKEEKLIKDQALVAKAKENIAKITRTSDKINKSEPVKKGSETSAPNSKNEDENAVLSFYEAGYRDELANRLKLLLRLPEYGMVKIRLIVDRKGRVKKFDIVAAESEVNRIYIENAVPGLAFPAFGNNFGGESEHTFLISLNNDL